LGESAANPTPVIRRRTTSVFSKTENSSTGRPQLLM
jgi:hypothetical protein